MKQLVDVRFDPRCLRICVRRVGLFLYREYHYSIDALVGINQGALFCVISLY
jgi:hypothetical protein